MSKIYSINRIVNGFNHLKIEIPENLQILENYSNSKISIPKKDNVFYGIKNGNDVLLKLFINENKDIANNMLFNYIYASGKEIGTNLIYSRFCDDVCKIDKEICCFDHCFFRLNICNTKNVTIVKNYYVRYIITEYLKRLDEFIIKNKGIYTKFFYVALLENLLNRMSQLQIYDPTISLTNIGIKDKKLYILSPTNLIYNNKCYENSHKYETSIKRELIEFIDKLL